MIRNLFSRTTCRHPSVCEQTPGPNELMCTTHVADEPLADRDGDRLAPWPLNRRSVWPTKGKRNG